MWTAPKTVKLTTRKLCHHVPSVSSAFAAPTPFKKITFGPDALAASIGRTSTLGNDPTTFAYTVGQLEMMKAQLLIAQGSVFSLTDKINELADAARTAFAGTIGAAITDLAMTELGYTWRDNGEILGPRNKTHPDFIYGDGSAGPDEVVIAEARGTFASRVTKTGVENLSFNKYRNQVRPFVDKPCKHGKIVHGYSIAFGSQPGTAGAHLVITETKRKKSLSSPAPSTPASSVSVRVQPSIVLSTHRSNFTLMGSRTIVDWIDRVRGSAEASEVPSRDADAYFLRVPFGGRNFLVATDFGLGIFGSAPNLRFKRSRHLLHYLYDLDHHDLLPPLPGEMPFGAFAIEETAGTKFLQALSNWVSDGVRDPREPLELPTFEPYGLEASESSSVDRAGSYVMYRDGSALLTFPFRSGPWDFEPMRWSPADGLVDD
jgi:hypothetical protein